MSPWALFLLSAGVLLSPWLVLPPRRPRPEIRGYLWPLWALNAVYCALWHRLEASALAPLPEHGPAILIANHTSGLDPSVLQARCRRVLGFLIAREFYEFWAFHPMCRVLRCIPVERNGRDLAATRTALRTLKAGRVVPIFPEGKIIPESGRVLGAPKPGAAFLILHARVPVIPAYIWGTPATLSVTKALLTPSRAGVIFGTPIDFSDIDPEQPINKALLEAVSARLMEAIRALKARAEGTTLAHDSRRPEQVLARYPAIAQPCSPPEALGHAEGGSGALFWRFESGQGTLVARAWPPDGPDHARLERIHGWFGAAAALGFVPVPLRPRDGRTLHEHAGRSWEVAPWLPGVAATMLDAPLSAPRLRAGFVALAAFHQCLLSDRARGPSPGLSARVRELEALLLGGFDTIASALELTPDDPAVALARQWLRRAREAAPRRLPMLRRAASREVELQPCLRDARPEHLLFEGDRVTGLVDFGAMGIDSVAADLARLLAEWVGSDRPARAEALSAYAQARPLSAVETTLIDAFESSAALLGSGHWVRWHWLERRPFDDPRAVERGIQRGLARLYD